MGTPGLAPGRPARPPLTGPIALARWDPGLVLPHANAQAMTLHLAEISRQVTPGAHAVVVLDGAGWHRQGGELRVPENVWTWDR